MPKRQTVLSLERERITTGAITTIANAHTHDHGGLTGLADDDHAQYHTDTRGDARYISQGLLTTRGDLIRRGATAPERYGLVVPASPTINYFGVANGEVDPTWKSASSNPGAAALLLQSNASGVLQLQGLVAPYVRPAADSTTALQMQNAAGTPVVTIDTTNSRVGIGATPDSILHLVSEGASGIVFIDTYSSASVSTESQIVFRRSLGSKGSPSALLKDYDLGYFAYRGYTGAAWSGSRAKLVAKAAEDWTTTAQGVYVWFEHTRIGGTSAFQFLGVDGYSNVFLGDIVTFDTTARRVVGIKSGTAPASSPTDAIQLYSADLAAGDAGLHVRTESGAIHKFASVAVLPGLIVNEDGTTTGDMRAESDTEADMLWLDASADALYIGGSTNGMKVAKGGHITLLGTATYFDDILNQLIGSKLESPSSDIVQNDVEGTVDFETGATLSDYVVMNVQMKHARKLGSNVEPHIHWFQASATMPNWLIQHRWQKQGSAKTTAWTSQKWETNSFSYTSGTLNQITTFGSITPPSGDGISDILQVRVIRDTTNASGLFAGADGLAATVSAVNFDVHIECDRLGSDNEYS